MRWRRSGDWPERPPRPKVRKLTAAEQEKISKAFTKAIAASPVLSYFKVSANLVRGRYYIQWQWKSDEEEVSERGRITPLEAPTNALLLEVEYDEGKWSEVTRGSPQKLIKAIASDTEGTFHALGSLDKSLRTAKQGLFRLPVKLKGKTFVYADSGKPCSVQEALFHYFGLPLEVIVQPQEWYSYHRTPQIAEFDKDRQRILVRFGATSWTGEDFGSTCLYLCKDGEWGAYAIRPSESDDIASAESWLMKRKWKSWSW